MYRMASDPEQMDSPLEDDDENQTLVPPNPAREAVLRDEANFIQNMSQFFNQEMLHDIILTVDGQQFYGHKFVLAKSSDVFRKLLYENCWSEEKSKEITLSEAPECQAVFEPFLRYLYTAEVSISTDTAVGILCLADKYNVASLKDLCVGFMIDRARSPAVSMALMWYPWAKVLHLPDLLHQCTQTIAWNFYEVLMSPGWMNMDLDFLTDLLSSSELVLPNEFVLWEGMERWLLQEGTLDNLQENSALLLPMVRLPMMVINQLYAIESSELYENPLSKDTLHSLLSKAYRFRALCPSQAKVEPSLSFCDIFYQPREYTDLRVHSVSMHNSMRLNQVDVRMFKGAVPSDVHEADWKITYRKNADNWNLQLYCHDTGLPMARVQPTLLFCCDEGKVIQVHREKVLVIPRGTTMSMNAMAENPAITKHMALLLKPVAC
ncbi:hypothetical protein CAPTEDRAFT_228846 [Capitella teleta]|uniref:BTB domain-containing protein n=1 Tax=Capitella teleta TaxID=283909 RepID=R7T555_CAPTE|nr:hypothetical protein CAPTEDRAFT_228846 [Capitella teleta]|eukprot:ELT88153.1 hypothetical protein CAPTEDRAFT_228846 [Capitella teleta]